MPDLLLMLFYSFSLLSAYLNCCLLRRLLAQQINVAFEQLPRPTTTQVTQPAFDWLITGHPFLVFSPLVLICIRWLHTYSFHVPASLLRFILYSLS